MERHFKQGFGKRLRSEFAVLEELPYPMRKALEALSCPSPENGDENPPQTRGSCSDDTSVKAPLVRRGD
jgi:hypothetical protein